MQKVFLGNLIYYPSQKNSKQPERKKSIHTGQASENIHKKNR